MQEIHFNTIPEAIRDIREGKMIIVVDDEDRENEGDFLMAGGSTRLNSSHTDISRMPSSA